MRVLSCERGSETPLVTVMTPTIPGREHWLEECQQSIRMQTMKDWEHIVVLDEEHEGCSQAMNLAARTATGTWLLPLADDDFLCPGGLANFLAKANDDADVVYAPPLVWGEPAAQFLLGPPTMTACALVRAEAWANVGGYDETLKSTEDRDLWERMLADGYRFVKSEVGPTRVYRFWHRPDGKPGNKSRG